MNKYFIVSGFMFILAFSSLDAHAGGAMSCYSDEYMSQELLFIRLGLNKQQKNEMRQLERREPNLLALTTDELNSLDDERLKNLPYRQVKQITTEQVTELSFEKFLVLKQSRYFKFNIDLVEFRKNEKFKKSIESVNQSNMLLGLTAEFQKSTERYLKLFDEIVLLKLEEQKLLEGHAHPWTDTKHKEELEQSLKTLSEQMAEKMAQIEADKQKNKELGNQLKIVNENFVKLQRDLESLD